MSTQVAVHELGHSLFGLADEYSTGAGDQTRPNCDVAGTTCCGALKLRAPKPCCVVELYDCPHRANALCGG